MLVISNSNPYIILFVGKKRDCHWAAMSIKLGFIFWGLLLNWIIQGGCSTANDDVSIIALFGVDQHN